MKTMLTIAGIASVPGDQLADGLSWQGLAKRSLDGRRRERGLTIA